MKYVASPLAGQSASLNDWSRGCPQSLRQFVRPLV